MKFSIEGGVPLKGLVRLGGAKNASFKIMIASLLTSGESRILNVPHIAEVDMAKEILEELGCTLHRAGPRTLFIETSTCNKSVIPARFGKTSRASTLFLGPLLARFGEAVVPLPGGDRIGKRPIERHLEGLKVLGAEIQVRRHDLKLTAPKLTGATYTFKKKTHTGTETLVMAGVLAGGVTILKNAAQEPEIDDLIKFLNRMGGYVSRKRNGDIVIQGVKKLKPTIHKLMPDRNEAVTYACAAIGTKGDIIVENARVKDMQAFLATLKEARGGYEVGNYGIRFYYREPLKATEVKTEPHPGFMTDWQPLWTALMTQAEGQSIIHETVFPSRFQYVEDLIKMGARVRLFEPKVPHREAFYNFNLEDDTGDHRHALRIKGPTPLKGRRLKVPDIRAGATLVLAALMAEGKSTLKGVEHIHRGYENLVGRLTQLGAKVEES